MGKQSAEAIAARLYARKAAGICTVCGKPREPEGKDSRRCEACATKNRARCRARYHRNRAAYAEAGKAQRARYREAGLCVQCGAARLEGDRRLCGRCREKQRTAVKAYQQRKREAQGIATYPRWDLGRRVPRLEGGLFQFQLMLDAEARDAIYLIVAEYRRRERAFGRQPRTHPVSFLVRDLIRFWAGSRCPVRPRPVATGIGVPRVIVERVGVSLDAVCRRVLEQHRLLHGSMVEALRAMVVCASPRPIAGTARRAWW